MLREFRADLHIHTCLSPCGDLSMLPEIICNTARQKSVDLIGICDHNSAENVAAFAEAGKKMSVSVLGGMEITTAEEVHILALFDDFHALSRLQTVIYDNLPGTNCPKAFGEQVVVDSIGTPIALNDKLLAGSTSLRLDSVVKLITEYGGLAIASHVDREAFGLIGQLGFVPENVSFDAFEVSFWCNQAKVADLVQSHKFPLIRSSDAHYPDEIGRAGTIFNIKMPVIEEIRKCLRAENGRYFSTYPGYS